MSTLLDPLLENIWLVPSPLPSQVSTPWASAAVLAVLMWPDSGSRCEHGVGHMGGDSAQKPLVSGPLEAMSSLGPLVVRVQGEEREI